MKYTLIFFILISTALASPPPESFLNSKAGIVLSGGNQPELSETYSFPVIELKNYLCRKIDGAAPKCGWKKLEGDDRFLLVRVEVDEVTEKKLVTSFVLEKSNGAVYVKRMVANKLDFGREGLSEMSKMMIRLDGEYKSGMK